MINRVLIRTRVLQVAYAHLHRGELSLSAAEQDLELSLQRTYDLYLYLLQLIPSLTDFYREVLEVRRRKHLATQAERTPNMRLVENRLAAQLSETPELTAWYANFGLRWEDDEALLRHLLRKIERSELYQDYTHGRSSDSWAADQAFWLEAFHQLIAGDELLNEYLEAHSIYWEDDLAVVEKAEVEERPHSEEEQLQQALQAAREAGTYQAVRLENGPVEVVKDFLEKTLRRATEEEGLQGQILPMFRDEEDELFARHLLRQLLMKGNDYMQFIEPVLSEGWSTERLADIDALLLRLGVTEFLHFPAIPTHITINEYVELAKHYSTAHSAAFVNGVLDAVARQLKDSGKIIKQ